MEKEAVEKAVANAAKKKKAEERISSEELAWGTAGALVKWDGLTQWAWH